MEITQEDLDALKNLFPDEPDHPMRFVESWPIDLRNLYIKELDVELYYIDDEFDSSHQFKLISLNIFGKRVAEYSELIKGMMEEAILDFMDQNEGHDNFNFRKLLHKFSKSNGNSRDNYTKSQFVVAFEYRALIEAIKKNNFPKHIESYAVHRCHRCLCSSF